jgi:hypothetical protein
MQPSLALPRKLVDQIENKATMPTITELVFDVTRM